MEKGRKSHYELRQFKIMHSGAGNGITKGGDLQVPPQKEGLTQPSYRLCHCQNKICGKDHFKISP